MNEGECIPLRILFQKQWGDHRQVRAHPNTRARAFASDFTFQRRPAAVMAGWLNREGVSMHRGKKAVSSQTAEKGEV